MQKEKTVKSYQRKTKSGKVVTVKQHTAKYNAADMAKEALKKKHGAGKEFETKKKGDYFSRGSKMGTVEPVSDFFTDPFIEKLAEETKGTKYFIGKSGKGYSLYSVNSKGKYEHEDGWDDGAPTAAVKKALKSVGLSFKGGKIQEAAKKPIGTGVNGPVKKSPKTKDVLPIPEDKTKKRMSPKSKPLSTGVNGPVKKKSK